MTGVDPRTLAGELTAPADLLKSLADAEVPTEGMVAYITVDDGPSHQYAIAERAQGGWQSGGMRWDDDIVTVFAPVLVLRDGGVDALWQLLQSRGLAERAAGTTRVTAWHQLARGINGGAS